MDTEVRARAEAYSKNAEEVRKKSSSFSADSGEKVDLKKRRPILHVLTRGLSVSSSRSEGSPSSPKSPSSPMKRISSLSRALSDMSAGMSADSHRSPKDMIRSLGRSLSGMSADSRRSPESRLKKMRQETAQAAERDKAAKAYSAVDLQFIKVGVNFFAPLAAMANGLTQIDKRSDGTREWLRTLFTSVAPSLSVRAVGLEALHCARTAPGKIA